MSETEAHNGPAIEPEGDWYGLYAGSTSRDDYLFTAESVRHPAKMSLALTNKILDTMQEWGWIENGSLVVDPFGGRGTSILAWLARHPANRGFSVELEPHFVEMQQKNKEHAERRLHRELAWVILQGDSRRFSEYYAEGRAASVLSAPYTNESSFGKTDPSKFAIRSPRRRVGASQNDHPGYGKTPGQIGNLPDSAITSAPYGQNVVCDHDAEREGRFAERRGRTKESARQYIEGNYGDTPGQIGRLKDPPAACLCRGTGYLEWSEKDGNGIPCGCPHGAAARAREVNRTKNAPGPVPAACVTSAPYENSLDGGEGPNARYDFKGHSAATARTNTAAPDYRPEAAVLSAPYAAAENRRAAGKVQEGEVSDAITRAYDATNHGQTAGNIANLPDACVTSAPYEDTGISNYQTGHPSGGGIGKNYREGKHPGVAKARGHVGYTDTAAVTSAPFEDSLASDDPDKRGGLFRDEKRRNDPGLTATYGDAAVTSAPWEATPGDLKPRPEGVVDQALMNRHGASHGVYADNQQGQIGVLQAENYADACGKVYASLAKAGIRYVASVTKDPVKNKRLRPLRLLTISLFEQAGYRLVAWRRAWLYHTQAELDAMAGQESLFGDEVEESKRLVGRLSFFRRLSLSKGGIASPFEDCLFFELVAPTEQPEPQKPEKPRWVQPELF